MMSALGNKQLLSYAVVECQRYVGWGGGGKGRGEREFESRSPSLGITILCDSHRWKTLCIIPFLINLIKLCLLHARILCNFRPEF